MTASIVQETFDNSTTSASTVSKAFASNTTAGNTIHVIVITNGVNVAGGFGTPSDGVNTYTRLDTAQSTNFGLAHWAATNIAGGAITVSVALGYTTTQHLLIIKEIAGVTTSPVDGHGAAFNNSQGTAANSVSTTGTSANAPVLASAVGYSYNSSGLAVGNTLAWVGGNINFANSVMVGKCTTESLRVASIGGVIATWSPTGASTSQSVACIALFDEAPSMVGAIPGPGPGVSPSARDQFHVPIRDTSGQSGVIAGASYSASTNFGNLAAAVSMVGQSYSVSTDFGQLTATGALLGQSYSVSIDYGTIAQFTDVIGFIPKGGPGISPSSLFQFSTLILDETLFASALIQGPSASVSTAYGALTGAAQFTGQSYDASVAYGPMTTLSGGLMAGFAISATAAFGNLRALVTPITPGVCTNLWSADGNFNWSADGYPGWSADGYEPTPLQCAVTALATVGVNVGTLSYQYSALVPVGWVITGYVPFINVANAGQYIPLTISEGPAPPSTTLVAPNVVGLFYYDAQLAILDAGFLIGPPTWALSTTVKPQYVISQSIPAGTVVTNQTQITIVVAGFPVVNQPGMIVPVP